MGLCVDGHVLRGKNGNAGHAGHMFVSDNHDALCGCGNIGDVEGLIAGNAIARRFAEQGYADAATLLGAARAGEPAAALLVDDLCRIMGRTLYNLVVTLDLQRISVGGSVFWHHRDFLLPKVRSHIDGKLAALTHGFDLCAAGLGEKVGDVGSGAPMPHSLADKVAAVAVFGTPATKFGTPVSAARAPFAGKGIDLCNDGDPICSQGRNPLAHVSYEKSDLVSQAVGFVSGML